MAILSAENYTKIAAGGSGDNIISRGEFGGTLKLCYDKYELDAAATGDLVYIATPPKGSKIVGFIISCDDLGSGAHSIDVGDLASDDRYIDGLDVGTAALNGTVSILIDTIMYEIGTAANDDQMTIKVAGSAVTGTVQICVLYV